MRNISVCVFILTFLLLGLGCSGSKQNPTIPGLQDITQPSGDGRQGVDVTNDGSNDELLDMTDRSNPFDWIPLQGPHGLWGFWQIMIDKENNIVEIVPLRTSNLHLNAVKFLEPGGEPGMLQIVGGLNWNVDKTILDVDVQITHPFPTFPQFSGFDVKGILIPRAEFSGFSDATILTSGPDDLRILNADGYTRWWNPEEFIGNDIFSYRDGALGMKDSKWDFKSILNGFKYFADTLNEADPVITQDIAMRGVFAAGSTNKRHYTIAVPQFPADLIFNYAVDASWAPPLVKPPDIPDDFPPEANESEPWAIVPQETLNTLFYDETISEQGGELILQVAVYDWQNPGEAPAGSIERVVGEWPGLFDMTEAAFISNEGDYSLWELILAPQVGALSSTNDVEYLIWAESTDGGGYGGKLDPSVPLISAARFMASVSNEEPNVGPQIQGSIVGNASPGLVTEQYTLNATDPNGDPLSYNWTCVPNIVDDPGNGDGTIDIDWAVFGLGNFTIDCSVSDSINPPVDAPPLDITVGNAPPIVGLINGPTSVDATFTDAVYSVMAADPDPGQNLSYMWSFVIDGAPENFNIPGDVADGTLHLDFSAIDPGNYDINVQVSDGYAYVNSTKLDVTHSNTAPSVGQVTGKTPVNSSDTDTVYSAPWADPDTTQTLSFLWSVVPSGNPEDFSVPCNPDGSLNIDWAPIPVGVYDLNLQAGDGIALTSGNMLTVANVNIPPTVGLISGPLDVSSEDEDALYTVTITDPDPFQTVTVLWSVVPTGNSENFNIAANPDDSVNIDWSAYADGQWDVNVQADDGYDIVAGTLITVTKSDNTAPEIGDINGLQETYCNYTNGYYVALITDPEVPPQTLTVLWSLVPYGQLPNFDIPAALDHSVTIDWSTYPVGTYDMNVQADDGFGPVVGTPITIDRLNTAPVVGSIVGADSVLLDSIETYSTDSPTTDCDTGQTLSYAFSVVPQGAPANYSIPSATDSILINWADYGVGEWTIGLRVFDGYDYSFAVPLDVVVALCVGDAHTFLGTISVNEYSIAAMSILPRADVAFINEGASFFGGNGVVQIGSHTLGIFDADAIGTVSVINTLDFVTPDTALSIDADPIDGRLLVVAASAPHIINILDPDTLFGLWPVDGTISSGNPDITWVAIDLEADGDLIAVQRDISGGTTFRFVRYIYAAEAPFYTFDPTGTFAITSLLSPSPKIFDIAVNASNETVYLLEAGSANRGRMLTFLVQDGIAPALNHVTTAPLFTDVLDYFYSPASGATRYGDVEVDHINIDDEECRIVLYGRLIDGRGEVIRMDAGHVILDNQFYSEGLPAFAINVDSDPGTRNLIMPDEDSLEYWQTPVTW